MNSSFLEVRKGCFFKKLFVMLLSVGKCIIFDKLAQNCFCNACIFHIKMCVLWLFLFDLIQVSASRNAFGKAKLFKTLYDFQIFVYSL